LVFVLGRIGRKIVVTPKINKMVIDKIDCLVFFLANSAANKDKSKQTRSVSDYWRNRKYSLIQDRL
jgi:hypothetical protein